MVPAGHLHRLDWPGTLHASVTRIPATDNPVAFADWCCVSLAGPTSVPVRAESHFERTRSSFSCRFSKLVVAQCTPAIAGEQA